MDDTFQISKEGEGREQKEYLLAESTPFKESFLKYHRYFPFMILWSKLSQNPPLATKEDKIYLHSDKKNAQLTQDFIIRGKRYNGYSHVSEFLIQHFYFNLCHHFNSWTPLDLNSRKRTLVAEKKMSGKWNRWEI